MRYIAIGLSLLLGACGQRVQSDVTAYHSLAQPLAGKTFTVIPDERQAVSQEWRAYADLVAQRLEQKGLSNVPSSPDIAVFLEYGINDGKTAPSTLPIYGQTGGGTLTTTGTAAGVPVSGRIDSRPADWVVGYSGSAATYTRVVKVWMFDTRRTLAEKRLVPVYEATAKSIGSANLNAVMPYILEAVFTDWPGKSGETKAVWTSVKG